MKKLVARYLAWRRQWTPGELAIWLVLMIILGSLWLFYIIPPRILQKGW